VSVIGRGVLTCRTGGGLRAVMRPVNGDVLARYDAVPVTAAGRKARMIRAFPRRTVLGVGLSCGYAVTDVAMGALGVRENADERAVHDEPARLEGVAGGAGWRDALGLGADQGLGAGEVGLP
jgi:hypothetical protein